MRKDICIKMAKGLHDIQVMLDGEVIDCIHELSLRITENKSMNISFKLHLTKEQLDILHDGKIVGTRIKDIPAKEFMIALFKEFNRR